MSLNLLLSPSFRRTAAHTTFVSHLGMHGGDHSILVVRERPSKTALLETFALRGAFDSQAAERLLRSLRELVPSALPLVLDLRGVSALDEAFATRLLRIQRELSAGRSVSFQVADAGPVYSLLCRLGLEERFGLEPAKRLLPKQPAVAAFSHAEKSGGAEKSGSRKFAVS